MGILLSMELRPKKLSVSVVVPPAPVRVPSQRPLAPSVASVTSVANDNGDPGGCAQISWHLPYSCGQKNFQLLWRCHQLLSGFLAKESVTSVANNKGDNEMILGAVDISPGICLTAEENLS